MIATITLNPSLDEHIVVDELVVENCFPILSLRFAGMR